MSNFAAALWDGTVLANVRYRFYTIGGIASAAEQSSGISQNASGRPIFPITCTVPSGAVTMEVYDNSQAGNWVMIALNFVAGDGVAGATVSAADIRSAIGLATANLDTQLLALPKIQAAVYDTLTISGSTLTLSNGHTQALSTTARTTT